MASGDVSFFMPTATVFFPITEFLCNSGDSESILWLSQPLIDILASGIWACLRPIPYLFVLVCVISYFTLTSLISLSYKCPGDINV